MKKLLLAAALVAGCASTTDQQAPVQSTRTGVGPTQEELRNDGRNTDNVLTYGMGYNQNRYSPLAQINKSNVKRLVPVWSLSLDNTFGEQAQPLVYDGVIYVSNAKWTVAIDAVTGKQLWRTPVDFEEGTPQVVCCGVSNKGVALYEGKVFRTTLDAHVVALDQKTGKEVWKQKVAEWKQGYSLTVAPTVANGVLITGCSGAEFGARCFLDGWDPATGKKLWRRYTTAGPGDKGHETWEPRESYLNGGASTWITGSYDPELDLVYWGTGNAGPWTPEKRKGDNLYVSSLLALRPKTGEIVWHYQVAPNDVWDWDSWEIILGELPINGEKRKVAMHMSRNGFLYVLDRTNGKLLSAKPYAKINWATHVDMATGRPVESEESKRLRAGDTIDMWPSIRGAKNWPHAAFNPNTGLLYANTNHGYSTYKFVPLQAFKPGFRYQGIQNTNSPITADTLAGYVEAIDPLTAQPKWRKPLYGQMIASAMLATGGGLLFTGKHTGEFMALDADTGETLWEFRAGSGINAQPITWTKNGKQYVTVLSGLGGSTSGRRGLPDLPLGGSVWTFALFDQ
ncbi:MAG TPA: PQQ-dependent dehydrogenase, methanol/ethanol family [Burkholderiales bacterium]|nr:PQQ-dependent dehydrogenase, methanol/ethanol family [Burkholderiales bacterium]